jgi:uncharacterized membrane protein
MRGIILLFLLLHAGILQADTRVITFTISAEVEKSSIVDLPRDFVRRYINDLSVYPKYFPDIMSVKKNNDMESVWVYRIDAPLAPAFYLTFTLELAKSTSSEMVLESKNPETDYLYCKAVFDSLGELSTNVTLIFKIRLTREKASDIHFLAGILGENFISARMKDKLDGDMETFIENATEDMHRKFGKSH